MIRHVLKDGTRPDTLAGHIVRISDAKTVYQVMESIRRSENEKADKRGKLRRDPDRVYRNRRDRGSVGP